MPKGKRKGKFEHRRTEQVSSSDEDAGIDLTIDKYSETSSQSDLKSNHDDAVTKVSYYDKELEADKGRKCGWKRKPGEAKEEDEHTNDEKGKVQVCDRAENEALEKLEEKVLEAVDGLTARAAAARASALVALRAALQRRPLTHVLASHRATLADQIARALRRGRDAEKRAAAALSPLLALQIGSEGCEEFVREVRPALASAAVDRGAALDTRIECCQSLAVLCYVLEEDLTEILEVMQVYETIFSGSYLKGDGTVKVSGAAVEEGTWHAAALDGWALLLPLLGAAHARSTLKNRPPGLRRLVDLLEAYSLEIRMAAGGALAIVHETLTDGTGDEALEAEERLQLERALPLLEELARDSHKYRAKRDRKLQRATFRDILKYFEEDEVPCLSVRVGAESLSCETWGARAAYGSLAAALGAGLQTLAPASLELRAALTLGDPPLHPPLAKLNKLQRHLQNAAACKARTLARNKNRDKRSATLAL